MAKLAMCTKCQATVGSIIEQTMIRALDLEKQHIQRTYEKALAYERDQIQKTLEQHYTQVLA
jgi:hypothetical protein